MNEQNEEKSEEKQEKSLYSATFKKCLKVMERVVT